MFERLAEEIYLVSLYRKYLALQTYITKSKEFRFNVGITDEEGTYSRLPSFQASKYKLSMIGFGGYKPFTVNDFLGGTLNEPWRLLTPEGRKAPLTSDIEIHSSSPTHKNHMEQNIQVESSHQNRTSSIPLHSSTVNDINDNDNKSITTHTSKQSSPTSPTNKNKTKMKNIGNIGSLHHTNNAMKRIAQKMATYSMEDPNADEDDKVSFCFRMKYLIYT